MNWWHLAMLSPVQRTAFRIDILNEKYLSFLQKLHHSQEALRHSQEPFPRVRRAIPLYSPTSQWGSSFWWWWLLPLLLSQVLTIFRPGWPETHYVDEVGLNGAESHLPLKSWGQRHVSSGLAISIILNKTCLLTTLNTPMGVWAIYRHQQETWTHMHCPRS